MSELKNKKIDKPSIIKGHVKTPGKKKTIAAITILAFGLFLMPTGFVLADVIQGEIDKGIAEQVSVPSKHSSNFDEWLSNDYDDAPEIIRTFYLWNLTNQNEYLNGSKPNYEEIGPFVFREYNYKYDVEFSDNKEEVTFKKYSNYVQVGGEKVSEVNITNINPGYLGARETAGGTDMDFIKLMFPIVLKTLRETFIEEYLAALPISIKNDNIIKNGMRKDLFDPPYIPPGINEIDQSLLPTPWNDPVEYNFSTALPAVSVFYEKWANDWFPTTNHKGIWHFIPPFNGVPVTLDNMTIQVEAGQEHGNNMVNEEGSASHIGVDIDGRAPYDFPGSETDLNISTKRIYKTLVPRYPFNISYIEYHINVGGSNITQEQCQALWDDSNPYSLTGFDYQTNPIWFNALDGNIESRQFLNDTFGLNDAQLQLILDWLNVSIHTWSKNVGGWTLNDWNSGYIVTRTAEEWLFTANDTAIYNHQVYYDQDLRLADVGLFDDVESNSEAEAIPVDKFTINTGRSDVSEIGQTLEFNGQDTIYLWATPEKIEGTDGLQFAPGVTKDDTLKTFQPDLMRVVELEYHKDAEIYNIELLRFRLAADTFSVNPNYYMSTSGLINLAPIEKYHDVPVRVSRPHLLGTDISILGAVEGMKPNGDLHDTYIDVEPYTGIVMNARNRIQVNFEVSATEIYYPNITHAVIPIAWYEQSGEITEELAELFKGQLYWALDLKENLPFAALGLGATLCVPGAALLTNQVIKRRKIKREGLVKSKYKKMLHRKGIDKKDKILDNTGTKTLKSHRDT